MEQYEQWSPDLKSILYLLGTKPVFNYRALYADMTADYVNPLEPEAYNIITLRFRTGKDNVDQVFLIHGDEKDLMELKETVGEFDYYETKVLVEEEPLKYYYEIVSGPLRVFYGQTGMTREEIYVRHFELLPGFRTPDWCKGAIMYQIYTDRFFNGDPTNDVENGEYYYLGGYAEQAESWESGPALMDVRRFHGGDLRGVIRKLPYLEELGVEVIYFNPLFVSPSNHKYDAQDYDYIDPHFGVIVEDGGRPLYDQTDNREASRYILRTTNRKNLEASNALFAELVSKAHAAGIRVILDGVFNHCGSFHKWLDREEIYNGQPGYSPGAFVSADSPYRDFFRFNDEEAWPRNTTYDGWWGHETLPKLNYEDSEKLQEEILRIARKWVSAPYNADGWRLDVAADLGHSTDSNHRFWKKFRKAVKDANPNAVIIAEHYGDAKPWLSGGEWDSVMNYDAFMEPVTWFLTGMQKHSDEYRGDLLNNADAFWNTMKNCSRQFTAGSLMMAMNELSNHDHSRFLTRTNRKVGRLHTLGAKAAEEGVSMPVMREAVLIQMTWIGAPTIYYGDEAGLCGFTDPDNRRAFPWGEENFELIDFHRACIRIRRENPELRTGSLRKLLGEPGLIAYARFNKRGTTVVVINNNEAPRECDLSVWECGVPMECEMKRVLLTTDVSFFTETRMIPVSGGRIHVSLPPTGGIVLKGPDTEPETGM